MTRLSLAIIPLVLGAWGCTPAVKSGHFACATDEDCAGSGLRCIEGRCGPRQGEPMDASAPMDASVDAGAADAGADGEIAGCAGGCDDGVVCTLDACVDGACTHTPDDTACTDGPEGTCDPDAGCQYAVCDEATCVAGPCEEARCEGGTCVRTPLCAGGQSCCDGVCTSLADDASNCGSCGTRCVAAGGTPVCDGGECRADCSSGLADCDADPATCETRLDTAANCGGCGVTCTGATPVCDAASARCTCTLGSCGPSSVCTGECEPGKRVFVSSREYPSTFGGVANADLQCQSLANAAGLGGTWRAWVSSSTSSVSARFTRATIPYRLLDGTVIANNWADLTDGTLLFSVSITEELFRFGSGRDVWTGTTAAGLFASPSCSDWTSTTAEGGVVGLSSRANSTWSETSPRDCAAMAHLYCFEQ